MLLQFVQQGGLHVGIYDFLPSEDQVRKSVKPAPT
jgi:hypothetical protein